MKRFIIFKLLFSLALCYTMEPEQNMSRILCTHDSIHRDLLIQHTIKCGLEPEMARIWNEWKEIPLTIQKSICKSYYDTQYQIYKDGCAKKNWPEGSIPSLLKFIGTPFDANTPYDNVPAIENVRTIMPQICLLKKIASEIPLAIQQNHINPLLNYFKQYQTLTLQKKICLKTKKTISALTCDNKNVFIGFYDGTIQIRDISNMSTPIHDTHFQYEYKVRFQSVRTLLSMQNYLISAGDTEQSAIPYYIPNLTGTITILDKTTKKTQTVLERNDGPINHLCPVDENHFASGSAHDVISVWNVVTGKKKHSLSLPTLLINALSYSEKGILASGPTKKNHQGKDSIFFLTKDLTSMRTYNNCYTGINSIIFYNNIIICGSNDGIIFLKDQEKYLEPLAEFSTKNPPLYNLIALDNIGFYCTKDSIKTFNLNFGYLSYTLRYEKKPTILTSFQEKFLIAAYDNGDIIIWMPNSNCTEIYQQHLFSPEISLLQLADEAIIDKSTEDSENSFLCSIQ